MSSSDYDGGVGRPGVVTKAPQVESSISSVVNGPKFTPIGVVHTKATIDEIRSHTPDIKSVVEVFPEFESGLQGIDGFSHIFVLGYFNQLRPEQVGPLTVRPKAFVWMGLKLEDLPSVGVFAVDSPTRPNPIGLSLVALLDRRGNKLFVSGLDYFEGTPVIDIKPYGPNYRVPEFKLPDWRKKLLEEARRRQFPEGSAPVSVAVRKTG